MSDSFDDSLNRLRSGRRLSAEEARQAIMYVCSGSASEAHIRDLLTLLTWESATIDELTGAARAMREMVVSLPLTSADFLDTCGTGGDVRHTFNVSTAAALIAASCGVKIVKHGNRSASGKAGSADVLEKMGVNLEPSPATLAKCLESINICFAFARAFHPAMKHVAAVRKSISKPTIFNLLGPLTNPARAQFHLLGVFSADLTERVATVLRDLGSRRAWVVCAQDGLDEISTMGPTRISELTDGTIKTWLLDPAAMGIPAAKLADIQIADLDDAAQSLHEVLNGKPGAKRDIALLNAAAAITIAGKTADLTAGLKLAAQAVDSTKAAMTLRELIRLTRS